MPKLPSLVPRSGSEGAEQVQGLPRVPELPDQFYILAFAGPGSDNFPSESTGFGSAILYQYFSVSGMQ